jgi:nitrate/nitrite transporter NarK
VDEPWQIGLLSAIPYGVAVVAMIVVGRHSDLTAERDWHIAASIFIGAAGLVLSGLLGGNAWAALAMLTVATAGLLAGLPLFWSLPPQILSGRAVAAGIGLINAVGCLAGFASPYALGAIKDATHSLANGLYAIAACIAAGATLVLLRGKLRRVVVTA